MVLNDTFVWALVLGLAGLSHLPDTTRADAANPGLATDNNMGLCLYGTLARFLRQCISSDCLPD